MNARLNSVVQDLPSRSRSLRRLSRWLLLGEWRAHPVRAITAVAAIAVGVALGFAIHLINAAAFNEFSSAIKSLSGQADVLVRAVCRDAEDLYRVNKLVLACEGVAGSEGRRARFAAAWEIRATAAGAGAAPAAAGTFESAPADWAEGDYAALTAKLSEAVAALARELAAALPK